MLSLKARGEPVAKVGTSAGTPRLSTPAQKALLLLPQLPMPLACVGGKFLCALPCREQVQCIPEEGTLQIGKAS